MEMVLRDVALVEEGWRVVRRRCEEEMACNGNGRKLNFRGSVVFWLSEVIFNACWRAGLDLTWRCGGDGLIGAVHDCGLKLSRYRALDYTALDQLNDLIQAESDVTIR